MSGRGVILGGLAALAPTPVLADVCDKVRPFWDPAEGPATMLDETLGLAASPASIALILLTTLALRLRNQWVGLAAVCGWSLLIWVYVFGPRSEIEQQAMAEGCIGSPSLFVGIVSLLSVVTVIYTAPNRKEADP